MLNPYAPQGSPAIGLGLPGLPSRAPQDCPLASSASAQALYSSETRRTLEPVGYRLSTGGNTSLFALPLDDQFGVYTTGGGGRLFTYDINGFSPVSTDRTTIDNEAISHCSLVLNTGDIIAPNALSVAGAATLRRHVFNRDTGAHTETTFASIGNGVADDGPAFTRSTHGGTWNHNYPNLFKDEQDNILYFGGMDVGGVLHYGVWKYASDGSLMTCKILFTPTTPPQPTISNYALDVVRVGRYYHLLAQTTGNNGTTSYQRSAQLVAVRDDVSEVIMVASGEGAPGNREQIIHTSSQGRLQFNADARSLTVQIVGTDNKRNRQYDSSDYAPHNWQVALMPDGRPLAATNNRIVTRSNDTEADGSWHIMGEPRMARVPDGSVMVPRVNQVFGASLQHHERLVGTDLARYNRSWTSRPALPVPAARYVTLAVTPQAILSRFEAVYSTSLDPDGPTTATDVELRCAYPLNNGLWIGLLQARTTTYYIQLLREV